MRQIPLLAGLVLTIAWAPEAPAQDRDTKVRNDRKTFQDSLDWIYNDLDAGIREAKAAGKPLMVVFRCIPCEACQEFDDDVARRDPIIRDLLDRYVCVRIVQANTIDLARFQYDFDQSFAVVLMHPDGTIYGRFGTRSARPESEDITLEGLRAAMEGALKMHKLAVLKRGLASKQPRPGRYKTPLDYPSLAEKFGTKIDYEGATAKSCMHCHQVREAERQVYRTAAEPIPDEVLYPYPDPSVLGLTMDPKGMATVKAVAPDSIAAKAGLTPGDAITTLAGQPLLSIADLQWVLHTTPSGPASLDVNVERNGFLQPSRLTLPEDWRRGDISWRVTTWDLRRMALGGMRLDSLTDAERAEAGLPKDGMALRVRHVGQFGDHAVAKNAGVEKGDVLLGFDGQDRRMTESEVIAHAVQRKKPGDEVALTVLRNGERRAIRYKLQ